MPVLPSGLVINEPVLREKCLEATPEEAVSTILMLENCLKSLSACAGLAAPQVGVLKQVSIIRHEQQSLNIINPRVLSVLTDNLFMYRREGCMSFPGRWFDVPRQKVFTFEYDALWSHEGDNKPVEAPDYEAGKPARFVRRTATFVYERDADAPDLVAIAVQHEIDHLSGCCLVWKEGAIEVTKDSDRITQQPLIKAAEAGRNDPCPCGAEKDGKPIKYKKCCGR